MNKLQLSCSIIIMAFLMIAMMNCNNSNIENEPTVALTDTVQMDISEDAASEIPTDEDFDFPTIQPTDESGRDPSLQRAISDLKRIVNEKKLSELMGYIDENIQVSFGSEGGKKDFMELWKLNSTESKSSEVWQEIHDVLELGGTFDGNDRFYVPYIFSTFPEQYDPFEFCAITGEAVRMRDQPSLEGKVIAALSYEIVKYLDASAETETINGEKHQWMKVMRANDQEGYIYGKYVRSPIDYRMGLEKKKGAWKIIFFVAGD